MKTRNLLWVMSFVILFPVLSRVPAAALPGADEVLKNFRDAESKLKNYSFAVRRLDLEDEFVSKRHDDAMEKYKEFIEQLNRVYKSGDTKVNEKEMEYRESISKYAFVKPFHVQMTMVKSDYLPGFLQKSIVFYDPDEDPAQVYLKTPGFGFLMKKDVQESESGTLMEVNWTYDQLEIDCAIANGGAPEVTGMDTLDDRKTYIVEFKLKNDKVPWKVGCAGETYGIPKQVHAQLNRELGMISDRIDKYSDVTGVVKMWFDADSWLIVKKEFTFGDVNALHYELRDIKLDSVDVSALEKPEEE